MMNNQDTQSILPILKKIPLLSELNEQDHQEIIKRITLQYYPAQYVVFKENDPGDAVFIIKRGMVKIYHETDVPGIEQQLNMLSDNDVFGEMAIISEKPRNAFARTMEESEIFVLKKEDFVQLVSSNPDMASRISTEFLKRLKDNMRSANS